MFNCINVALAIFLQCIHYLYLFYIASTKDTLNFRLLAVFNMYTRIFSIRIMVKLMHRFLNTCFIVFIFTRYRIDIACFYGITR